MKKLFIPLFLILVFAFNDFPAYAHSHPVHKIMALISYWEVSDKCRDTFLADALVYGSIESDYHRTLLRNPSHKNDTIRIKNTYYAALKVADSDPNLANRRVARGFHYILDQSEADDNIRKKLHKRTFGFINSREIGEQLTREIFSAIREKRRHPFNILYKRKLMEFSRNNWSQILETVRSLRREMNIAAKDAMDLFDHDMNEARKYYRKKSEDYFAKTAALQTTILYHFCVESQLKSKKNKKQDDCSQSRKDGLLQTINNYNKKWAVYWCTPHSWSGCGAPALNEANGLRAAVHSARKNTQCDWVLDMMGCKDGCMMGYPAGDPGARQRGVCLKNCIQSHPWPK